MISLAVEILVSLVNKRTVKVKAKLKRRIWKLIYMKVGVHAKSMVNFLCTYDFLCSSTRTRFEKF